MSQFKAEHSFGKVWDFELTNLEKRKEVANKIQSKYPDRIPVIVEKAPNSKVPEIDRKKYLVPKDITVGAFETEIRKHMKLKPEEAIFLFVNNTIPPTGSLISQVYDKHKESDGLLYVTYSGENTFGSL
jgi:GABA(A) receptor-associated protein